MRHDFQTLPCFDLTRQRRAPGPEKRLLTTKSAGSRTFFEKQRIVFYEPAARYPHVFQRFHLPRLGTVILGTILKRAGYDVSIYVDGIRAPKMQDFLDADLVGISTITSTAPRAYRVAQAVRARGVPVVLGGPHVTFMPEEALNFADYVFRGEAENSIVRLVRAIGTGEGLESVPGLSFRRDGEIRHNEPAEPVSDLDALPHPDFNLLRSRSRLMRRSQPVPIQTSRGCPYDCSFCSVTRMFGRKYRFRSVEQVLDDLSSLALGGRHVFFYDDHFAASKKRLYELLEGKLSRGLKFPWSTQVRGDVAGDERLVALMRRAGCRTLFIGMESTNPEALDEYGKGQTVSDIEHSVRVLHRHGIGVYGMFVLGADADTAETVRATSRFASRNRLHSGQFLILTPLPGTSHYEKLERQGRLLTRDWSFYDGHHVVFEPARMTPHELESEVVRVACDFYSPRRILADAVRLDFFGLFSKIYYRRDHLRAVRSPRALGAIPPAGRSPTADEGPQASVPRPAANRP